MTVANGELVRQTAAGHDIAILTMTSNAMLKTTDLKPFHLTWVVRYKHIEHHNRSSTEGNRRFINFRKTYSILLDQKAFAASKNSNKPLFTEYAADSFSISVHWAMWSNENTPKLEWNRGGVMSSKPAISPKLCKIAPRLLRRTNRKLRTYTLSIGTKIDDLG